MSRFEKVPSDLAGDYTLTLQARAVYPILLGAAFRAGARAGERVELPPLAKLAVACGCSTTSLKGYVSELRRAGWVETTRAARGRPQLYTIRSSRGPESDPQDGPRGPESGSRVGQNPTHSRTREGSTTRQKALDKNPPNPPGVERVDISQPPALRKSDGQDVALNALCEVCGIDPKSPRVRAAVAAMNGRGSQPGIRHLYWEECRRYADEHDEVDRLVDVLRGEGDFERALEARVRRKVALLRERQPWRTYIAPAHVRDLWLDIERDAGTGGASAADIEKMEVRL